MHTHTYANRPQLKVTMKKKKPGSRLRSLIDLEVIITNRFVLFLCCRSTVHVCYRWIVNSFDVPQLNQLNVCELKCQGYSSASIRITIVILDITEIQQIPIQLNPFFVIWEILLLTTVSKSLYIPHTVSSRSSGIWAKKKSSLTNLKSVGY